jgi:hypothetical protein
LTVVNHPQRPLCDHLPGSAICGHEADLEVAERGS